MNTAQSTDQIQKVLVLDSPRSRVWRAITDVSEFNKWFGVTLESPFTPGAEVKGKFANAKYAHVTMSIQIESVQPEDFFSFRWHPYALEEGVDYSSEPTTLVSFAFEDVDGGTQLTITESGFDAIPASRRAKAFEMNANGWEGQSRNIRNYLANG